MVADNLSLSLSAADVITRKLAGTEKKKKTQRVLVSGLTIQTSFGHLMRTIDIPLDCEDGGPSSYKLLYIDPCGMLEEFCIRNPGFAELLCTSCPDGRFPLALYSDELCAGNPLKPDGTRMLQAIYTGGSRQPAAPKTEGGRGEGKDDEGRRIREHRGKGSEAGGRGRTDLNGDVAVLLLFFPLLLLISLTPVCPRPHSPGLPLLGERTGQYRRSQLGLNAEVAGGLHSPSSQ